MKKKSPEGMPPGEAKARQGEAEKQKKKVSFVFDSNPPNQALNLISKFGFYQDETQTAFLDLEPNEIARTVERLVDLGAVPVNVETQNLLESKYLEITA